LRRQSKPETSKNTIFTEDAAAAARARLKSKLGRVNTGLDPETMRDGITLAGYHIEKGARTFTAYAKAMIEDLGEAVKPYLKSWYMGIKFDPRAAAFKDEMNSAASVELIELDSESLLPDEPISTEVSTGLTVEFGGKRYPVSSLQDASDKWGSFRDESNAGASET